jgi:hypothetical protein
MSAFSAGPLPLAWPPLHRWQWMVKAGGEFCGFSVSKKSVNGQKSFKKSYSHEKQQKWKEKKFKNL